MARTHVARSLHGILVGRREGEHSYFKRATGSPVFSELRSILIKTTAVVDVIRSMLKPFVARFVSAFLYGSIARTEDHEKRDVSLMIVVAALTESHLHTGTRELGMQWISRLASHFSLDRAPTEFYKHIRAFLGVTTGNVP